MRIGINEFIIYDISSDMCQREMNVLPALLRQVEIRIYQAIVYVNKYASDKLICVLTVWSEYLGVVRTPITVILTYQRILGRLIGEVRLTRTS